MYLYVVIVSIRIPLNDNWSPKSKAFEYNFSVVRIKISLLCIGSIWTKNLIKQWLSSNRLDIFTVPIYKCCLCVLLCWFQFALSVTILKANFTDCDCVSTNTNALKKNLPKNTNTMLFPKNYTRVPVQY